MTARPRIAVVGGGVSGLAAALDLVDHADVTLFEATDRVGGPVRTVEFAGESVEAGPDAFLARRPEMIDLAARVGFATADLISPTAADAGIWTRGAVRQMPGGLVMGVPRDAEHLGDTGIISAEGVARAAQERDLPVFEVGDDVGMGDLVRRRFGEEVFERLVDPLMGGVHAGRSELLSTAVAVPQLLAAARSGRSLSESLPVPPPSNDPVFYSVRSGLERVIDAVAKQLPDVRLRAPVEELRVVGDGWEIAGESFDAVIVATHAPVTARLIEHVAPDAAAALATVEYASVVLTLLAYPTHEFPSPPSTSGYLVPRVEHKLTSAVSYWNAKWSQRAPADTQVVRASTGRSDDVRHRDLSDEDLVARLHAEFVEATGVRAAAPIEACVSRYENALPQFKVGHLTDVTAKAHAAAAAVRAPLALAGSCYEGLGLPACVASGQSAAKRILSARRG
ncbi:MAG: protoporphyrinogen/coproporphyrinogen oxidase [Actinomycetota bacterium]|jgi:oxygen-dependent protoporphyrinogen oxidase